MYESVLIPVEGPQSLPPILPHITRITMSGLARKVTFLHIAGVEYPQDVLVSPTCNNIIMNPKARVEAISRDISESRIFLDAFISSLNPCNSSIQGEVLHPSSVVETIVRYIVNHGIDLLIMITRARSGLNRLFFGNKSEQVLRLVNIPVMMIRI